MNRKALGRGLNALMGEPEPLGTGVSQLPINLIDPNPFQPRRLLAEDRLQQLADSIQQSGIVQPLLVRAAGDRYQIIAGERRWRAARLAKLHTVPAVVRHISDNEALEFALTENLLRDDLSAIEVAYAYEALQTKFGYTHERIAEKFSVDRSTVTNTLRLLKLPPAITQLIENKILSYGHARALLSCQDAQAQTELAEKIVKDGISVRQAERLASEKSRSGLDGDRKEPTNQDPNARAAILELERALGTRVKMVGDGTRGRIEISYYSAEDLNRLYEWIVRK